MILSIRDQNHELALYLLSFNLQSINSFDKYGKSPLMYASEFGFYDIVEILIEKGADINMIDKTGKSALILAVKNNHLLTVETILTSN